VIATEGRKRGKGRKAAAVFFFLLSLSGEEKEKGESFSARGQN